MPNLTSVGVASGVPNSGTGTVSTLDALMALIGEVQSSPTSNTTLDRLKTIAAAVAAINTALGVTAFDLGLGTNGTRTLRVAVDTAQTEGSMYVPVAASQADAVIQISAGATGNYLSHVIVIPAVAACGLVTIKDNSTTLIAFVGGGTTAMPSVAPFVIPVGMTSVNGAWKITTGADVSCVAVGNFT